MRKTTAFLLFMLLASSLFMGCGASKNAAVEQVSENISYDAGGVYDSYAPEEAAAAEGEGLGGENAIVEEGQAAGRKLIRNVSMDVETQDYDTLLSGVEARVEELGGYVEQLNAHNGNGMSNRSAELTIRIPSGSLDAFVTQVEEQSNVVNRQESVEDVTLQYVDLESHKKMLTEEQERLLELLKSAETMEDIIALESRLTEVRYQLESMEAMLRQIDNQVDYSTVRLSISEVIRLSPPEEKTGWQRIKTGFSENVYRVTHGIGNFAIELVIALPILLVIAVLLLLLAAAVHFLRKVNAKRALRHRERKAPVGTGTANRPYPQGRPYQQGTTYHQEQPYPQGTPYQQAQREEPQPEQPPKQNGE